MIPAPALDFSAVMPLLLLAIGSLVVLLAELFLRDRSTFLGRRITSEWIGSMLAILSSAFLGLVVVLCFQNWELQTAPVFNLDHPMLRLDRLANFGSALICLATLLSCLLSVAYLAELRINYGEYYALMMLATCGMVLLVCAADLVTVFLGIELMSIPIYVLAGFDRRRLRSNESALKYFLVGSFASAILLYGMALLYGATGATHFDGIRAGWGDGGTLGTVGLALVVVGFAFKISSVPFHQWTPDVYEGAPTTVTAWMSVTVKSAAFIALLRLVVDVFGPELPAVQDVLWVLAAATMIVGNAMALIQDNLKRMLAYSSIAHAGYLMLGLVAGTTAAYGAMLFYLLAYAFMNLGAFAVLVALAHRGRDADRLGDLAGLASRRPGLAAVMTLFMVSLAGLPPTAGFIGKFQLFMAAVEADVVVLTIVAVLTTVVSVYYYLRIPVAMYMREPGQAAPRMELASGEWLVLVLCGAAVIVLGVLPNSAPGEPLEWLRALDWGRESITALAR